METDKPRRIFEDDEEEAATATTEPPARPTKAQPENVATPWTAHAPGARKSVLSGHATPKRLVAIVVLGVLAFVGLKMVMPKPPEPQSLAIEFAEGNRVRYRVFVTYSGTRTLGTGKEFPVNTNLHATVDLSVAEVSGDTATLDVRMSNVYASGPSPFVKRVPSSFRTQVEVSKDGTIRSGQLGLANAMIGYLAPGWDLLFPQLPPAPVQEGATWNTNESLPVVEGTVVAVSGMSSLTGTVEKGAGSLTVVTGNVKAPVKAEIPLAEAAASIGVTAADYGLPVDADPTLAFDGETSLELFARLDGQAGVVEQMYLKGNADYTVVATGVPGLDKAHSTADISVAMSVKINKQEGGGGSEKQDP